MTKKKPTEVKFFVIVFDTKQHKFSSLSPRLVGNAYERLGFLTKLNLVVAMKAVLKDGKEVLERIEHHTTLIDEEAIKHFFMVWGHDFNLRYRLGRSDFTYGGHLEATFGQVNGQVIMAMIENYFPQSVTKAS